MNPNATITIEDPRQLTWSATVLYPYNSFWLDETSALAYPDEGGTHVEFDESDAVVMAKRIGGLVREGFQVTDIHAYVDAERIGSWSARFMLGGERKGHFGLKLYGPGKGITEVKDPQEMLAAIVRTHSDGWHLQPDGSYVRIDPS